MKKIFKNIMSFGIVAALFFLTIFCCCLTEVSHANTVESSFCHQGTQNDEGSQESNPLTKHTECQKDCEAGEFLDIVPDPSIRNFKLRLSSCQSHKTLLAAQRTEINFSLTGLFPTAGQGPPGKMKSAVPLYLKHSILRI